MELSKSCFCFGNKYLSALVYAKYFEMPIDSRWIHSADPQDQQPEDDSSLLKVHYSTHVYK